MAALCCSACSDGDSLIFKHADFSRSRRICIYKADSLTEVSIRTTACMQGVMAGGSQGSKVNSGVTSYQTDKSSRGETPHWRTDGGLLQEERLIPTEIILMMMFQLYYGTGTGSSRTNDLVVNVYDFPVVTHQNDETWRRKHLFLLVSNNNTSTKLLNRSDSVNLEPESTSLTSSEGP